MLVTIQFRIFCLPVCHLKTLTLKDKTKIFSVVLYGCKSWSLAVREEHRLRVDIGILGCNAV
jgi:hypothetical protein